MTEVGDKDPSDYLACISYHEFLASCPTLVQTSSLLGNQFKSVSPLWSSPPSREHWSGILTCLSLWGKVLSVLCFFLYLHLIPILFSPRVYDMPHAQHISSQVTSPVHHCFGLNSNSWVLGCAMWIQRGRQKMNELMINTLQIVISTPPSKMANVFYASYKCPSFARGFLEHGSSSPSYKVIHTH